MWLGCSWMALTALLMMAVTSRLRMNSSSVPLGVAPGEVSQELVDCLGKIRRSGPDLAFADEHVGVLHADQDVGLALVVENLTAGRPSKTAFRLTSRMKRICSSFSLAVSDGLRSRALRGCRKTLRTSSNAASASSYSGRPGVADGRGRGASRRRVSGN